MRDPDRIDGVIETLREFWKLNPDWRLGQLVYNVTGRSRALESCPGLFYIEDDKFVSNIENWRND